MSDVSLPEFVTVKNVALVVIIVLIAGFSFASYAGAFNGGGVFSGDLSSVFSEESDEGVREPAGNKTMEFTEFEPVTDSSGLNSLSHADAAARGTGYHGNEGVYVVDYNGDGYPDVLTLGSNPTLYENVGGEYEVVGVFDDYEGNPLKLRTAHFFDYDRDGDKDLVTAKTNGRVTLYENRGDSEFVVVNSKVGGLYLDRPTVMASADYNGDGCLDLFVGQIETINVVSRTTEQQRKITFGEVPPEAANDLLSDASSNKLLKGDCSEEFTDVTKSAGVEDTYWTLAASFVDVNGDGHPDIHTANDFSQDVVYINNGDGTFTQRVMGPATARHGMSSEVADVNGDLRPDIFVTNIYVGPVDDELREKFVEYWVNNGLGNNMLVNSGEGKFTDKAGEYGVRKGGWGWSATIEDFDNDGNLDVFHATGEDIRTEDYERLGFDKPQLFVGEDGTGFQRVDSSAYGFTAMNGRGVSSLDYDRDGSMDVLVASNPSSLLYQGTVGGSTLHLYENQLEESRFVQVRLNPNPENHLVTGSKVYLETSEGTEVRYVNSKAGYLSQEPQLSHFGLSEGEFVESITVVWPDGSKSSFSVSSGGQFVVTADSIEREHDL